MLLFSVVLQCAPKRMGAMQVICQTTQVSTQCSNSSSEGAVREGWSGPALSVSSVVTSEHCIMLR